MMYFGTSYYFWGYVVFCYILLELTLRRLAKMKPVTPEQVERDKKYVPFYKPDTWVSESLYARVLLLIMVPLIPVRFIVGWGTAMLCAIGMLII